MCTGNSAGCPWVDTDGSVRVVPCTACEYFKPCGGRRRPRKRPARPAASLGKYKNKSETL